MRPANGRTCFSTLAHHNIGAFSELHTCLNSTPAAIRKGIVPQWLAVVAIRMAGASALKSSSFRSDEGAWPDITNPNLLEPHLQPSILQATANSSQCSSAQRGRNGHAHDVFASNRDWLDAHSSPPRPPKTPPQPQLKLQTTSNLSRKQLQV